MERGAAGKKRVAVAAQRQHPQVRIGDFDAGRDRHRPTVDGVATIRAASILSALLAIFILPAANLANAQEPPDKMVQRISEEVMAIVRSDPAVQRGDRERPHGRGNPHLAQSARAAEESRRGESLAA